MGPPSSRSSRCAWGNGPHGAHGGAWAARGHGAHGVWEYEHMVSMGRMGCMKRISLVVGHGLRGAGRCQSRHTTIGRHVSHQHVTPHHASPPFVSQQQPCVLPSFPSVHPPTFLFPVFPPAPLLMPLQGHTGDINSVVLSEDGTKLFSSGDDKTVRVGLGH